MEFLLGVRVDEYWGGADDVFQGLEGMLLSPIASKSLTRGSHRGQLNESLSVTVGKILFLLFLFLIFNGDLGDLGLALVALFLFSHVDFGDLGFIFDLAVDCALSLALLGQVSLLVALETQVVIHVLLMLFFGELVLGVVGMQGGGGCLVGVFGGGFAATAGFGFEPLEVLVNHNGGVDEDSKGGVDKVGNALGDILFESIADGLDVEVVGVPSGSVALFLDLVDELAGTCGLGELPS